jgi:hypothetical protein
MQAEVNFEGEGGRVKPVDEAEDVDDLKEAAKRAAPGWPGASKRAKVGFALFVFARVVHLCN